MEVDSVLQLASYFAGEVLQSMKHGILVRAFNVRMLYFLNCVVGLLFL